MMTTDDYEVFSRKMEERFPKMFENPYGGFAVGAGWWPILESLCANIQSHIDYSVKRNKSDNDYNMMLIEMHQGKFDRFNEYHKGYQEHYVEERREKILKEDFRDVHPIIDQVTVEQIKEKFGGLRFYYQGGDDTIHGMVRMAEAWADHSCEECGKPGERRSGGWIRTLCNEHEAEHQARLRVRHGDQ
jgi:hypothetical protein